MLVIPAPLVALVCVAASYVLVVHPFRDVRRIQRLIQRDEWQTVRVVASRVAERGGLLRSRRAGAYALAMHGIAALVLGDLAAARRALAAAEADRHLDDGLRPTVARQLAAVAATEGHFDDARRQLDAIAADPGTPAGDPNTELQLALLHLQRGDAAAAVVAARAAVAEFESRRRIHTTQAMREAFDADLAQAQAALVRALLRHGDLEAAADLWAGRVEVTGKLYVHANQAEAACRLALGQRRSDEARQLLEVAREGYRAVGAQLDVVRMDVLGAEVHRAPEDPVAAEARLVELGARGHLGEVDEARRALASEQ